MLKKIEDSELGDPILKSQISVHSLTKSKAPHHCTSPPPSEPLP